MIKKKILSICIILSAMILSELYSTPQPESIENPIAKKLIALAKKKKIESQSLVNQNGAYLFTTTFAEEVIPNTPQVEKKLQSHLDKFSFKNRGTYDFHTKADLHLDQITAILKKYGVPEDFKYIPLVESGMNPRVTSHKGAGGYWQFMPATARLYGLRVNAQLDERKDLIKSTHAAAQYLKSLYKEFGDWTLVAAAYNVGGGSLKSSMRRQQTDDYYKMRLNSETASYVYKLISMKEIIENPEEYGYVRYANSSHLDQRENNML